MLLQAKNDAAEATARFLLSGIPCTVFHESDGASFSNARLAYDGKGDRAHIAHSVD